MLRVPNLDEPEILADWLEASLLSQEKPERIADAEILDSLSEAGRDREEGLHRILQQYRHRRRAVGRGYPISRNGQGFSPRGRPDEFLCYSFLLFASLNQSYNELNYRGGTANEPAVLFELVTAKALGKFLNGETIRIGAPRQAPVPFAFPAAVDYLAATIQEPVGRRDLEKQESGDDGLDIWAIKPFGDDRTSQLCVIAQCAIGQDWQAKRTELSLDLWQRHIDWFTHPIKAFAVPFHHNNASWRETAITAGLIVDRPRIARLVLQRDLDPPVAERMRRWLERRIRDTVRRIAA